MRSVETTCFAGNTLSVGLQWLAKNIHSWFCRHTLMYLRKAALETGPVKSLIPLEPGGAHYEMTDTGYPIVVLSI